MCSALSFGLSRRAFVYIRLFTLGGCIWMWHIYFEGCIQKSNIFQENPKMNIQQLEGIVNVYYIYMYIKRTDWNLYINLRETKKIKKEIKKIHKNHKYSELTGRENPFDLTNVLGNKHERIFWGYSRYGVLIKVEIKILCCVYINRNSSVRRKSLCNRNSHHMRVWHWCRAGHQHKWIRYHRTLRWSHLQYICFV